MKVGKPKSKRTPVRLRHKIQKASAAKAKKDKKLAKKNPEWRSKLKKDPGIPNLFPYKDKILAEIEEGKRRKEEEQQKKRDDARARREGTAGGDATMADTAAEAEEDEDALLDYDDDDDEEMEGIDKTNGDSNPMAALLASARRRANQFDRGDTPTSGNDEDDDEDDEDDLNDDESIDEVDTFSTAITTPKDTSRKSYDKAFKQVISASDVILYVLDARDPLSTRSATVEQAVTASPNKRLILILNKIDLVPAPILKSWLQHLRLSFPTLPLRASSSAPNAKTFDHKHLTPSFTSGTLVKALKSYAAGQQLKRAITVGVIGYPNVGKSSVINALTARLSGSRPNSRTRTECPVGAEAGVTTALREVKLDNKIKLIDSPGIVFPATASSDDSTTSAATTPGSGAKQTINTTSDAQAHLILLNALPSQQITDPIPAVSLLLRRLSANEDLFERLLSVYGLPALLSRPGQTGGSEDVTTDFLVQVARKRGRLGKGGVPNLHAAAQTVVSDWRDGRIQGWVEAPKRESRVVGDEEEAAAKEKAQRDEESGKERKEMPKMVDEKKVVTEWAKEFSLPGLWGDEGFVEEEGQVDADAAMVGA